MADRVDPGVTNLTRDPARSARIAAQRVFLRLNEPDLAPHDCRGADAADPAWIRRDRSSILR